MAAPITPTITGFSEDTGAADGVTTDRTITFFGTGTPGASLEVIFANNNQTAAFLPTIPSDGNWSVTRNEPLPNGVYEFFAGSRNDEGASPVSQPISITVEGPQVLNIDLVNDSGANGTDNITANGRPEISFTAGAGDALSIDWGDGNGFVSVGTSTGGTQFFTKPESYPGPLQNDQAVTITVRAENGGLSAQESFAFTLDRTTVNPSFRLAPESDTGITGNRTTNDTTPTITGVGEPGARIDVSFGSGGGQVVRTTTVDASGNWSVTLPEIATQGFIGVVARAEDRAGNVSQLNSSVIIDTITPDAPTLADIIFTDTGESSTDRVTNDATVRINGTTESNTIVRIYDGERLIGTDTSTNGGNWSLTTLALADGTYDLVARAEDAAGNMSGNSNTIRVIVDTTPPASPTITLNAASDTGASNSDGITSENSLDLSGTAEANSKVEIFNGSTSLGSTTAAANGSWSFSTPTLTNGVKSLTARATDLAGNLSVASPVLSVTVDTVALATPTITGFSEDTAPLDDGITADRTPTLTGTAENNSTVEILRDNVLVGTVTANGSGAWSYTSPDLTPATYGFTARSLDLAGNVSEASDALNITIQAGATATPVVTQIVDDTGFSDTDGITNDATLFLRGTTEAGSSVEVYLDGVKIGDAIILSDAKQWVFDYTSTALPEGTYEFTAIASAPGKDPSSVSDAFVAVIDRTAPTEIPVVTSVTEDTGVAGDFVTGDDQLVFSGTASPGSLVAIRVSLPGVTIESAGNETDASGNWTIDFSFAQLGPEPGLRDGSYNVSAFIVDAAGNEGPLSTPIPLIVDTVAPDTPTITGFSDNTGTPDDTITSDNTITLTGTAEANASVLLQIDGDALATVVADGAGAWSYTTVALANATYAFTAKAVDLAGNESAVSPATTITVERSGTPTPVVTAITTDTGPSATDGVTSDATLVISGTAQANVSVDVFIDTVAVGTTTADQNGVWSFDYTGTTLADATYSVIARATATASNPSDLSAPFGVTVDTTSPDAPTLDLAAQSDLGTLADDKLTSDTTPTLTGTTQANALVEVFDGTTSVGTTTANGAGNWSLTTAVLTEGTKSLTARATDLAGNTSAPSVVLAVTIDITGPAITQFSLDPASDSGSQNSDSITSKTTPTLNYVVTGEAKLEIDWKDGRGYQVIENTGSVTQDVPYAEGGYSPTLRATDAAGNVSISDELTVVLDLTAPDAPVITGYSDDTQIPDDGITRDDTPTLTGTAEAGAIVTVLQDGNAIGTTQATASGDWSFTTLDLASSTYVFAATATDVAGNTSASSADFNLEIESNVTPAPSVTSITEDTGVDGADRLTNDTTLVISGTAQANASVEVFIDDLWVGIVVAGNSGDWSLDYTGTMLSEGPHVITARATSAGETVSEPSTGYDIRIDTTVPAAPTIDLVAGSDTGGVNDDNITNDTTPSLTGTAEAGVRVTIFDGAVALATVTADVSGVWTYTATALVEGVHAFSATATDAAGNVSPASDDLNVTIDTTAPVAPIISGISPDTGISNKDGITSEGTLTVYGTGTPGTVVDARIDGQAGPTDNQLGIRLTGTAAVDVDGNWSITFSGLNVGGIEGFSDGPFRATAVAVDAAGNRSADSAQFDGAVDLTAPDAPTIDLVSASDSGVSTTDNQTNDNTPTLTGLAEANAQVEVFNGETSLGTATANAAGVWSLTPTALPDGVVTLTAQATDIAGNFSARSTPLSVTIDTTAPIRPEIAAFTDDSGVVGDATTNDVTPTLTINAAGAVGVEVFDGEAFLGNATAGASGVWTFTSAALTDGPHQLTAVARDLAGNQSTSLPFSITLDTVAPAAPTLDLSPASDTGTSDTDNLTNDATPTLSGTAEAGSSIEVFRAADGDPVLIGSATADGSGVWQVTAAQLPEGLSDITAVATDAAGNRSVASPALGITVDTTAPAGLTLQLAAASDSGNLGDGQTNDNTPLLIGTAEAGARVEILLGSTVVASTLADATGSWSYQSVALDVGAYSFTARATDAAGNQSAATPALSLQIQPIVGTVPIVLSIVDDTGRSDSDGITSDTTPAISGTGVSGETVTAFIGTVAIGSTVVTEAGTWTVAFAGTALADGEYSVTATATAPDGIASQPSGAFNLTVNTTAPSLGTPDLTALSDSGARDDDNLTNDTTPTISFTAEAGADLEIDWGNGQGFVAAGTGTGANQTLTFGTGYAADGGKTVQLRATDAAGNTQITSVDLTIDSLRPSTGTVVGFSADTGNTGDQITSDQELTFNGSADPASTVRLSLNGAAIGQAVADSSGRWVFDYSTVTLAAGAYALTVSSQDAAGNISLQSDDFDFTVLDLETYSLAIKMLEQATTYRIGTKVAQLEVTNFDGPVSYELIDDLDGAIAIQGDEIVIVGPFDPSILPTLEIGVTATILGGEQLSGTVDLTDFVTPDLVGEDGIIRSGPADDLINGTSGDDIIFGGYGDDKVEGGNGDDALNGGFGDDTLTDRNGDDVIDGAGGDDVILAMNGRNVLLGGDGNDLLLGGLGEDRLEGGSGNDVLQSDRSTMIGGRDQLNGGTGNDLLEGGVGVDTFIFRINDGEDTIGALAIDFTNLQNTSVIGADFQSGIDQIALIDFGYANSAEAFSHLSDINGQATFSDQGLTLHFAGLTVADLAQSDFFIF